MRKAAHRFLSVDGGGKKRQVSTRPRGVSRGGRSVALTISEKKLSLVPQAKKLAYFLVQCLRKILRIAKYTEYKGVMKGRHVSNKIA